MRGTLIKKIAAWSIVGTVLFAVYMPILLLVFYSFATMSAGKITGFSFGAYIAMFGDAKLMTAVFNTLLLAAVSAVIATVLGAFTAIGMFSMKRTGRNIMSGANQITVVNADIVTGVSFSMLFVFVRDMGLQLPRGWLTLIIAHVVITVPYVILTVMPRLRQLNANVYEAALDLGATPLYAVTRVILPQLFGAMVAGFALAFTLSLDDFVITKYNNGSVQTLSTLIYGIIVKHGIPNSYRALSSLFFVLIMGILVAVNVKSRKKKA